MTTTLTNPTRKELIAAFDRAVTDANGQARARLIDGDPAGWATRVRRNPAGTFEVTGGGVANAYGCVTGSSGLCCAWYTRPDGTKVVRIAAGRASTSGRHVPTFGIGDRATQKRLIEHGAYSLLVHTELSNVYRGWVTPLPKGFFVAIHKQPGDVTAWLAAADWMDDNGGNPELAALIRAAFLPVSEPATVAGAAG